MTTNKADDHPLERALILLADQSTQGLDRQHRDELSVLLAQLPDLDEHTFDHAAAALELAFDLQREPLPKPLVEMLAAQGQQILAKPTRTAPQPPAESPVNEQTDTASDQTNTDNTTASADINPVADDAENALNVPHESRVQQIHNDIEPSLPILNESVAVEPPLAEIPEPASFSASAVDTEAAHTTQRTETDSATMALPDAALAAGAQTSEPSFSAPVKKRSRKKTTGRGHAIWGWVAAALALAVAVFAWWPKFNPPSQPDVSQMRGELLDTFGSKQAAWQSGRASDGASGDIVWNPKHQIGYMRFHRLSPNDPTQYQYHLWIEDAARDPLYAVDGGLFDVPAGDESIVLEFKPRLPVTKAERFVVTLEPAGGLVVNDRHQAVLTAVP